VVKWKGDEVLWVWWWKDTLRKSQHQKVIKLFGGGDSDRNDHKNEATMR